MTDKANVHVQLSIVIDFSLNIEDTAHPVSGRNSRNMCMNHPVNRNSTLRDYTWMFRDEV